VGVGVRQKKKKECRQLAAGSLGGSWAERFSSGCVTVGE